MLLATDKGQKISPHETGSKEDLMKIGRMLSTVAATALLLALSFSSAAFAHAGEPHAEASSEGLGWLVGYAPPLFALGGVALVGLIYFATRPRG